MPARRFHMEPGWEERIKNATKPTIRQVTEEIGNDVREVLARHVKTGALLRSLDVDLEAGTVKIGTDHWEFLEYGTSPHTIRIRDRKVLAEFSVSGWHFLGKEVHHPGTRSLAPLRRALYKKRGR